MRWRALAVAVASAGAACSPVRSVYQAPARTTPAQADIKRVQVVAWAPASDEGLRATLTMVAGDYLRLKKNFLVQDAADDAAAPSVAGATSAAGNRTVSWASACTGRTEGVLLIRALESALDRSVPCKATLRLAAEMYRCDDGALVFRSEGALQLREDDAALKQTRRHYAAALGEGQAAYVPCAFSLLQQLLTPLCSPTLSDEELEEKIELGMPASAPGSKAVAALAQPSKRGLRPHHAQGALHGGVVGPQK